MKFFKESKKKEKRFNSTYSMNKFDEDGINFLTRMKNDALQDNKYEDYPYQIGIAVSLHDPINGFPSPNENNQLLIMEKFLEDELANADTIFVGTIMGGGMKEFIFYTRDADVADSYIKKLVEEIKHHEIQYVFQLDKNWEIYKTYSGMNRSKGGN